MPSLPISEVTWHRLASSAVDIGIWLNDLKFTLSKRDQEERSTLTAYRLVMHLHVKSSRSDSCKGPTANWGNAVGAGPLLTA